MIIACLKCGRVTIISMGDSFTFCKSCGSVVRRRY